MQPLPNPISPRLKPICGGGWIGIDLDNTAAFEVENPLDGKVVRIGNPIPLIIEVIQLLRKQKKRVVFYTARVSLPDRDNMIDAIEKWSSIIIGEVLPITCIKDPDMIATIDDRSFHPASLMIEPISAENMIRTMLNMSGQRWYKE
jgi:hypothetical protein